ncbi:hypothetical protein ACT17S_00285 [Glutamicibacter mysorens]
MEPWIPIAVAIIAAMVSLIAALASYKQATNARKSAEKLDSRAHRIARIDTQVDELREAFKSYADALGQMRVPSDGGRVMGALEVLSACAGATPKLQQAALDRSHMIAVSVSRNTPTGVDPKPVRDAYREAQEILANMREKEATDKY